MYIDLSKAFDMINQNKHLSIRHYYGIHNTALNYKKHITLQIKKQYCDFKRTKYTMLSASVCVMSVSKSLLPFVASYDFETE